MRVRYDNNKNKNKTNTVDGSEVIYLRWSWCYPRRTDTSTPYGGTEYSSLFSAVTKLAWTNFIRLSAVSAFWPRFRASQKYYVYFIYIFGFLKLELSLSTTYLFALFCTLLLSCFSVNPSPQSVLVPSDQYPSVTPKHTSWWILV